MQKLESYLGNLSEFLKISRIYLVGGLIRDNLLGKEKDVIDCDFTVEKNAYKISKKFAEKIDASWFVLDDVNKIYRVVKKSSVVMQFDFSIIKGKDIVEDLKSRDYTVNAIALELKESAGLDFSNLIDPCYGRLDLEKHIIRCIKEENIVSDPIRILRGISVASDLGFEIEEQTYNLLKKHAGLLETESGERISEELFKILKNRFCFKFFEIMNDLNILDYILPGWKHLKEPEPGPYHHLPVDLHSIESLRKLELLLEELSGWREVDDYLNEEIREHRMRVEILKLAALLHDIGKPAAYFIDDEGKTRFTGHDKQGKDLMSGISEKLKLSKRETQMIKDMIYYHLRPGFLVDCMEVSKKAVFRYFRDTKDEALSVILLSIADKEATRGRLSTEDDIAHHKKVLLGLMRDYFDKTEEIKPPRLVTGHDVMDVLKIPPSPKVGQILKDIEEKQALGEIKNREDAIKHIKASGFVN